MESLSDYTLVVIIIYFMRKSDTSDTITVVRLQSARYGAYFTSMD